MAASSALALDLDLEPFCGPFDLLLALVLWSHRKDLREHFQPKPPP